MGHVTRSTLVGRPAQEVFAVLADVARLPEVSDMTVDVQGPGRPVQVGDSFDQVVRILGKELETTWRVVALDPPSRLEFEGRAEVGASATLVETLTPEDGGTRVEIDVEYDLPLGILGDAVDAVYLRSKNEEQADEILAKLKALCESAP